MATCFSKTFLYNAHTTGSDALWSGLPPAPVKVPPGVEAG